MKKGFKILIKRFNEINSLGYVKGVSNLLTNACGLTFEKLLGKKPDSKYLPDFNGIEIKTSQRYSRHPISLFSLSFNGPNIYESNSILQKYGIFDKKYNENYLVVNLYTNNLTEFNNHFFKININYSKRRLEINIYDKEKNKIETRGYISFRRLKKRITTKIKYLAVINASKKEIDGNLYFRYYKISCYKYKNFKTFLKLIETGDIETTLMLRFAKSGNDIGKNKNKSMIFKIKKDRINELFNELYTNTREN